MQAAATVMIEHMFWKENIGKNRFLHKVPLIINGYTVCKQEIRQFFIKIPFTEA